MTNSVTIEIPKVKFDANGELIITASTSSSERDFDFYEGKRKLHNRKLISRLSNSAEWIEFESTQEMCRVLNQCDGTNFRVGGNYMKTTLHTLTLGLLAIFFSCGQPNDQKNIAVIVTDTLQPTLDKREKERLERGTEIEEQGNIDSLMLDKVLKDALTFSTQNIDKEKFYKEYEAKPNSA